VAFLDTIPHYVCTSARDSAEKLEEIAPAEQSTRAEKRRTCIFCRLLEHLNL